MVRGWITFPSIVYGTWLRHGALRSSLEQRGYLDPVNSRNTLRWSVEQEAPETRVDRPASVWSDHLQCSSTRQVLCYTRYVREARRPQVVSRFKFELQLAGRRIRKQLNYSSTQALARFLPSSCASHPRLRFRSTRQLSARTSYTFRSSHHKSHWSRDADSPLF